MYQVSWIRNGSLRVVNTPSVGTATSLAAVMFLAGQHARLWKMCKAGPVLMD